MVGSVAVGGAVVVAVVVDGRGVVVVVGGGPRRRVVGVTVGGVAVRLRDVVVGEW